MDFRAGGASGQSAGPASSSRRRLPASARGLAIVGGAVLAVSTTAFLRVSLLPLIGATFAMTPAALGLLTTAFAVGRLAADLPAGGIADRAATELAMGGAALGIGLGSLLFALAWTPLMAFVAMAAIGIASALTNTTGMTFFSTRARASGRGRAMALFSAALLGGQALGPAIAGLISAVGSWRTAEAAGAAIGFLTGITLLGASTRGRRGVLVPASQNSTGTEAALPRSSGASGGIDHAWRPGERVVLYSVSFVSFFALGAMPQTLVPLIGAHAFRLSAATIGLALGLGGICRFVGALAGGLVSDRVSRKAALVPGLTIMACGVGLLAFHRWSGVWLAAIMLLSLGSFGISVAATILADATQPGNMGRRFGSFRLVGDLGLITGPLVAALLYSHVSQAFAALVVAAMLAAVALASARYVRWGAVGAAIATIDR